MMVGKLARVAASGVVLAAIVAATAEAACLQANTADQVAQGRLKYVTITDEAYERTEHAYILQLPGPACLDGTDYDKVESAGRIHVFAGERPLLDRLRRLVGKDVAVHGNPFGEHTAHHHAPIVMRISSVERLR